MHCRLAILGLFIFLLVMPSCAKRHAKKDSGPVSTTPARVENFDPTKPANGPVKMGAKLVAPDEK
jgi:hypothetical protein